MKHILTFLLISIVSTTFSQEQTIIDSTFMSQISEAKTYIQKLKSDQNIPSISIAVGYKGQTIWAEALGLSDIKNKVKANTTTKYRIGSIGKPITALALAKLRDNGQLDFDQDVRPLIPQLNSLKYPISIRQIAGHQSGIRHYKGLEYFSKKQYNSVEECLSIFINDDLEFDPGSDYLYSTYGYVLLGRIIEIISKKSYSEYMLEDIFIPLNMTNTVVEDTNQDESNSAKFYSKNGKRELKDTNVSYKQAGGAFLSTPLDIIALINNAREVIDTQTLFELITPQNLQNGKPTGYGIGFKVSKDSTNERLIIHHGGRSLGARSYLLALPAEQIVLAICTNSEAEFGVEEIYELTKIFIND